MDTYRNVAILKSLACKSDYGTTKGVSDLSFDAAMIFHPIGVGLHVFHVFLLSSGPLPFGALETPPPLFVAHL
jgi:hypothetical protein